jgi:putative restriction endonuclease
MYQKFDDIRTDEARALQVYLVLLGLAADRKTTTYGLLAKTLGFGGAGVFSGILGHIMFWCEQNKLPALTSLVVGGKSGIASHGLVKAKDKDAAREEVYKFSWYDVVPPTALDLEKAHQKGMAPFRKRKD